MRVVRPRGVIVAGYSPFLYGAWGPWGPWGPWGGGPGWWGPPPFYAQAYLNNAASLRLQVTPKTAEVYVDGYLAGTVDQFDGTFQRLRLEPGEHDITIYASGFRSLRQRLYLQPASTSTIKGTLDMLQPGDIADERPTAIAPRTADRTPPVSVREPRRPGRGRAPEPPSAPAPEPDPSEYGVVAVRVQPSGAQVFIDGEEWEGPGNGEQLLVQLAPGTHQLEIRRDGYQTFSRAVDIRPGDTTALNVALARAR